MGIPEQDTPLHRSISVETIATMLRREFLRTITAGAATLSAAASMPPQPPLGYNTYSVRAMRWNDLQLLEYAASLKVDAVYLQDSVDPANDDPAHWKVLKETVARLGL